MVKRKKIKKKYIRFLINLSIVTSIFLFFPHFYKPINTIVKEKIIETKPKVNKISLIATGDGLIHGGVYKDAYNQNGYDFTKQLELVKPLVQNYDLAYWNQETLFAGSELGFSNYPRFNTPQEFGDAMIDAGFNMVSLANNHSMDKNEKGAINSITYWQSKKADVLSAGMYLSAEDRLEKRIWEKNNITYTLLSYTTGTNGLPVPTGKDYLVNVYEEAKVKADIERMRAKVDVLIVAMHWGSEYTHVPTEQETTIANYLASLNVDIILGCHPHVIQPIEKINNTLVIYSLGNFISAQDGINKKVGMLVSLDITKTTDKNISSLNINNINVDLLYTYHNGHYRDFKVVPFSIMEDKYLADNANIYEKYKAIIEKSNVEVNVKALKSGL